MEITTVNSGNEATLSVKGCLDTAATAAFVSAVDAAAKSASVLVFDFSDLEFIASSALRKLVSTDKTLSANGGKIVIAGASDVVREVLDVTGLDEVFEMR